MVVKDRRSIGPKQEGDFEDCRTRQGGLSTLI